MPRPRSHKKPSAQLGQLRIIGGEWRGRKLQFPAVEGLRPTADRVRETLFNWLAADIEGSTVLDLFAGSGALGLEALSRGADHACFVERDRSAAQSIQGNLHLLQCTNAEVTQCAAADWLPRNRTGFDIVFLDPPFRQGLLEPTVRLLTEHGALKSGGWLYIELGKEEALPRLPEGFTLHRDKTAGQTRYLLYRYSQDM